MFIHLLAADPILSDTNGECGFSTGDGLGTTGTIMISGNTWAIVFFSPISETQHISLDNLFKDVLRQSIMKRFLATVLLSGVIIMNMGMFCHSLCIGGHNEKAHGHQHPANAHVHSVAQHKMSQAMTQEAPQKLPHGEGCPMGQDMRQGKPNSARHPMPETLMKCGCTLEDDASSAYEATFLKPIIADLTPHLKTVLTVNYQHTLFSSRGPIPVEGPPKLLS